MKETDELSVGRGGVGGVTPPWLGLKLITNCKQLQSLAFENVKGPAEVDRGIVHRQPPITPQGTNEILPGQ